MFELDIYGTLVAASGVLLLGQLMLKRIPLLAAYTIPEPVAGGLLAALLLLAARSAFGFQVQFDNSLGAPLMLTFFACIGLNADLASLRQGGRPLMIFLAVVLGFLMLQNVAGLLLALALGQSPFFGLLAGSIALSGGHGTGVAWGKVFAETYGVASAAEIALAESSFEKPNQVRLITAPALIETLALISICLLGGQAVSKILAGSLLELPAFVCVLFIGVTLRNSLSAMALLHRFRACRFGTGQCLTRPVPRHGVDDPPPLGVVGTCPAHPRPAFRPDAADDCLRDLRHFPGVGPQLRRSGDCGRPLRFWPGRNTNRDSQHAGTHQPLRAVKAGFSRRADGRGLLH